MCFSNLPVEFDEEGDPYLAEEAEDVDRPGDAADDDAAVEVDLADDPEGAYEAIVSSLPENAHDHVGVTGSRNGRPDPLVDAEADPESAGGD